ncbi:MAG: HNH endonuclease [Candidatus Odinarchaeota archaeon]
MSEDKLYHSKDWLYNQFIILDKFISEIAKEQGVAHSTILYFLKKFKIRKQKPKYQNKEWLEEQYLSLGKSTLKIAKEQGCHKWTISKWLHRYQIPIRDNVGINNPMWKGGISREKRYNKTYKPNHPNSYISGFIAEHTLIMEKKIGRLLKKGEIIHHIDEDIRNNHPDNLYLCKNAGIHQKIHFQLQKIAIQLYKKGIIGFNRDIGKYYIIDKNLSITKLSKEVSGDDVRCQTLNVENLPKIRPDI